MYSYKNYHLVKEEIEKRRKDAESLAMARNEELRAASPAIRMIDDELSGTGLLLFRTACSGGDISKIRERNQALMSDRKKLIAAMGLPEDYTEVKYSCKTCSDTGYIDGARMCSCFREGLIKATIASSGIGDLIENQSFDNFDLNWYKDDEKIYARMCSNLERARA